jgi:hypothetical protein
VLQASPHDVPLQVALPPVTVGQAEHDVPQLATLVLLAHDEPQAW